MCPGRIFLSSLGIHFALKKKLVSLKILPMNLKFKLNDLVFFHKIFYNSSIVKFPSYIHRQTDNNPDIFQRTTRQYNNNDRLKVKCTITPKVNGFKNSFFYSSHNEWNKLPLEIRAIEGPDIFKTSLIKWLWSSLDLDVSDTDHVT